MTDAPAGKRTAELAGCLTSRQAARLLDDELPAEERKTLERHIGECSRCRQLLEDAAIDDDTWPRWESLLQERGDGSRSADRATAPSIVTRLSSQGPASTSLPDIPGYDVLTELGRGGMGVVYRARHQELQREVAVKMLLAGAVAGPEHLARFRAEAESLARLQHPNIIQIHDIGDCKGVAFLSLELAAGGSLQDLLAEEPLEPRTAALLLERIAEAVAAAHDAEVVHRDLKPANILLSAKLLDASDVEAGRCEPKISDFGLARQLDSQGWTRSDQLLGTPNYMAPEQFSGRAPVGPLSDVYALGCLLYEMLAGRPPLQSASVAETIQQVLAVDPVPVRLLNPAVPRDLETICGRCLEKHPHQRYASAHDLAEDLKRWRQHQPIRARRIGPAGRLWRWSLRNPTGATLAAVLVAGFMAGTGLLGWRLQVERGLRFEAEQATAREQRATRQAQASATKERQALRALERSAYPDRIQRAHGEWLANNVEAMLGTLATCPPDLRGWEWNYLRQLPQSETRSWQARNSRLRTIALNPEGSLLVIGANDGSIAIWDATTGEKIRELRKGGRYVVDSTFNPDGTLLATSDCGGQVVLWNVSDWTRRRQLVREGSVFWQIDFSANGTLAGARRDGTIQVWDVVSGEISESLSLSSAPNGFAISPDGQRCVVGFYGMPAQWLDMSTGEVRQLQHTAVARAVWAPSGGSFAVAGRNLLHIYDAETVELLQKIDLGVEEVADLVTRGERLAVASRHKSVSLFAFPGGRRLLTIRGHDAPIGSVAMSEDGRTVFTADDRGIVKRWDPAGRQEFREWDAHDGRVLALAGSRDGRWIASVGEDGFAMLWTMEGDERATIVAHSSGANCVAFSPDGERFATGGSDGCVCIWDRRTGEELHRLRGGDAAVWSVAFNTDGSRVAAGARDAKVRVWDAEEGLLQRELIEPPSINTIHALLFWGEDELLAAGTGPTIRVWRAASGELQRTLGAHDSPILGMTGLKGARLASASTDGSAAVWSLPDGELVGRMRANSRFVSIAGSPDGTRAATTHGDATLRIWDVKTRRELLRLQGPAGPRSAMFSADGDQILATSSAGKIVTWTAEPRVR